MHLKPQKATYYFFTQAAVRSVKNPLMCKIGGIAIYWLEQFFVLSLIVAFLRLFTFTLSQIFSCNDAFLAASDAFPLG